MNLRIHEFINFLMNLCVNSPGYLVIGTIRRSASCDVSIEIEYQHTYCVVVMSVYVHIGTSRLSPQRFPLCTVRTAIL